MHTLTPPPAAVAAACWPSTGNPHGGMEHGHPPAAPSLPPVPAAAACACAPPPLHAQSQLQGHECITHVVSAHARLQLHGHECVTHVPCACAPLPLRAQSQMQGFKHGLARGRVGV
eukprot:346753-Pelagomonas_calceolata.AAC.1